MVHYFKFTLAIFNFNCLTLILIEKIGFWYFSNNSSPTFTAPKIMKKRCTWYSNVLPRWMAQQKTQGRICPQRPMTLYVFKYRAAIASKASCMIWCGMTKCYLYIGSRPLIQFLCDSLQSQGSVSKQQQLYKNNSTQSKKYSSLIRKVFLN